MQAKDTHPLIHVRIHTCMRKHTHHVRAYTMPGRQTHASIRSEAGGDTHKHRYTEIRKHTHTRTHTYTCERGKHTQDSHLPTLSQERGEKTTRVVVTANGMTGHLTPNSQNSVPSISNIQSHYIRDFETCLPLRRHAPHQDRASAESHPMSSCSALTPPPVSHTHPPPGFTARYAR